jgi:hypothetical protein
MKDAANDMDFQREEEAKRIAYLIGGYLKQTLSEAEHDELDEWVGAEDDNMRLFEELTDPQAIKKHFDKLPGDNKIILTTEKDAVRLVKFEEQLKDFPLYVLPIEHRFLFNESASFDQLVTSFIASYKK